MITGLIGYFFSPPAFAGLVTFLGIVMLLIGLGWFIVYRISVAE